MVDHVENPTNNPARCQVFNLTYPAALLRHQLSDDGQEACVSGDLDATTTDLVKCTLLAVDDRKPNLRLRFNGQIGSATQRVLDGYRSLCEAQRDMV